MGGVTLGVCKTVKDGGGEGGDAGKVLGIQVESSFYNLSRDSATVLETVVTCDGKPFLCISSLTLTTIS